MKETNWREQLRQGLEIDVIYKDNQSKPKNWQLGQIEYVKGDNLTILLPKMGESLIKDRWSSAIAQPGTHSRFDQEWRQKCLHIDTNTNSFPTVDYYDRYLWREALLINSKYEERLGQ